MNEGLHNPQTTQAETGFSLRHIEFPPVSGPGGFSQIESVFIREIRVQRPRSDAKRPRLNDGGLHSEISGFLFGILCEFWKPDAHVLFANALTV